MPAALRLPTAALWTAAVALLLAALFALEAMSVRDQSLTYDAPEHLRYGRQVLRGDATRFDDSKMPVSAWNALPGRLAEALPPGGLRSFLAADRTARYPTMLASLVLAWLVWRWSRELYGPAAGLLSLVLYVLDPNLLAHSRFVTTDLYAALTVTLALYAFHRFLEAPDRRSRRWRGLGAALAFGLAQVAKYSGAYLAPVLLLVAAVRFGPAVAADLRSRAPQLLARRAGAFALWAAVFVLATVLVVNAAFLFQDPFWPLADFPFRSETFRELRDRAVAVWPGARLPLPYPYLEGLDWVLAREQTGEGYGNRYLLGETRTGRGFLGYYLVAALYKVPLPTLIVWITALAAYAGLRRRGGRFRFARDEAFLLVPAAFFTVYFNFFFQAQMGIRYLLPVFPLLHVFAGCLLAPAVWGELRPGARRGLAAAGAALAVWLAASVLSYYPHLLPYMNELLPERKLAYRVLADSNLDWGQDSEFVARYLAEHPEVVWQPAEPTAGRILVGTNWLTGVFKHRHDTWLRDDFEPVGHLRYSHLLFEVSEAEAERLRPAAAQPSPPRR
jgi:4-amino-4-deoxy-L-arabinose transferase-like glycosyltransferase